MTPLVGRHEGHPACKTNLYVGWCLVVTIWSFACLLAPVVTTTSVILSSNKIQNEDVLVPANPDPPGKRPLKQSEMSVKFQFTSKQQCGKC